MRYVCGQQRPEDLSILTGTRWVVASWLGGGLAVIDSASYATAPLYPAPDARERLDQISYAGCPGSPTADTGARPGFAGTGVRREENGTLTVYAVRFGRQRMVDVFQIDIRSNTPVATWVGCVTPPQAVAMNDVAALPDGGFVSTNWSATAPGEVWEWQPNQGWRMLAGTENTPGPNGVVVSSDGRWVYFAGWQNRSVYRVSRGVAPPRLERTSVDFHPDNLNFAPDGSILAAGQSCVQATCEGRASTVRVSRVDPQSLQVTPLIDHAETAAFGGATTAIQVGIDIWVGSFRADRVAIFPQQR